MFSSVFTQAAPPTGALQSALDAKDRARIDEVVAKARRSLGENAGVPEVPDQYAPVPAAATALSAEEVRAAARRSIPRLKELARWKPGLDPLTMKEPLRAPARVVSGLAALSRAGLDEDGSGLALAKDTADFLLWAQSQAGGTCFPFPAARGTSSAKAMQVASRFLEKAERAGKLDSIARNGWVFDDLGDGGLQFDNAECGVAMFELAALTKEDRYLAAGRKAADWAASRPLCGNWNYNAFSVRLLAHAYQSTREPRYLAAAKEKALLGVMPGQLKDGPRAGRWLDPHNARPAYHYIMAGALAKLLEVLPFADAARAEVAECVILALKSRNTEILEKGVMTREKALDALLLAGSAMGDTPDSLAESRTAEAASAIMRLCSEDARAGKLTLGPREWGLMLEHLAAKPAVRR